MTPRPYFMTPGLTLAGRVDLAGAKLARTDVRDWLAQVRSLPVAPGLQQPERFATPRFRH